MSLLKLMTLNIGNPSFERVKRQIEWLDNREEDVLVLTETKSSEGCRFLKQYFSEPGCTLFDFGKEPKYNVYFPESITGDLGVMILSKFRIKSIHNCFEKNDRFYSRFLDVELNYYGMNIGVIGLYVPSRDSSKEKIERKKQFAIDFFTYLKHKSFDCPYVVCGDFNILEKTHIPRYSNFLKWEYAFYDRLYDYGFVDAYRYLHQDLNEYSWVGRTNDGYRYDHIFVSENIKNTVLKCNYIHETRQESSITDHSAMIIELSI